MNHKKFLKFIHMFVLVLAIALLVFVSFKLFPMFANLGTPQGQAKFQKDITSQGLEGILYLLGLQLLQILVPILPGEPIELLAGMCYGTFGGLLLIFVGAFLSSCLIFFSVRTFGRNFIDTFLGKDKVKKIEHNKLFTNRKQIEFFLLIAFLIPGTPKDFITYIAGLLPIRASRFLLISTFARFPSVITSTFAGANLVSGNLHITIITYAITLVFCGICLYFYKKQNKNLVDNVENN